MKPFIESQAPVFGASIHRPEVFRRLHAWAEAGLIGRLDSALANQLHDLNPGQCPPELAVALALLSHLEGQGHTALPVAHLLQPPAQWWGWPADTTPPLLLEQLQALARQLPQTGDAWVQAWSQSRWVTVAHEPLAPPFSSPDCTPLVLFVPGGPETALLYLRRHWWHESVVAHHAVQRAAAQWPVDAAQARCALGWLFPPESPPQFLSSSPSPSVPASTNWQALACALALRAGLTLITGGPGTGKTHTVARLLALVWALAPAGAPPRIALAAPTGKAAARLRESLARSLQALSQANPAADAAAESGNLAQRLSPAGLAALASRLPPAQTLHALLGTRPDTRGWRHHAGRPLEVDWLVVDEVSMVHLEMMSALFQALKPTTRLVLLGDADQLASVEAGAVLGDLCTPARRWGLTAQTADHLRNTWGESPPSTQADVAHPGLALAQQTVRLRLSRRFDGAIGQLARAVHAGDAEAAANVLATARPAGVVALPPGQRAQLLAAACEGLTPYLLRLAQGPWSDAVAPDEADRAWQAWVREVLQAFDRFRLLCAVRGGEWGTEGLNASVQQALAAAGHLFPRGEWFAGRPVMVTRNDPELGVANGDVGVVMPPASGRRGLRVCFMAGDRVRSVSVGRLVHVETAFAMTVHKSQGSEFEHALLVLPAATGGVVGRELVYTGITRARQRFTLAEAVDGAFKSALARTAQRSSGLGFRLAPMPLAQ